MVFRAPSKGVALAMSALGMLCWGNWPTLRRKSQVSVVAFAPINMLSQFFISIVYALMLGTPSFAFKGTSNNGIEPFPSALHHALLSPTLQVGAVFLGGFLLGHGDHLCAIAMDSISPGIAYPVPKPRYYGRH